MSVHPISNRGTRKQNCRPQYLWWRGRENHFGREQRTPFAGGGVVVRRAADEFDFAIQFFYKTGGPEGGDGFAGRLTKPERIYQFHAASITGRVGQRLSKLKNKCRSEERRVGKECRSRWSPY